MSAVNELVTTEEQIKIVLNDRTSAIYAKDLFGVLDKYAPDVVSFDIGAPLQSIGIEVIKKRLLDWFASYKGYINQELNNLVVDAGEQIAISHCLIRTFGTGINGEKFDMWYRATNGFHKFYDRWLITHEHLSEPINMETGSGMFDLKP